MSGSGELAKRSPKVFISFSSQDSKKVRMLFYALKQQEVEVWDYSGKGEELPLGQPLEISLKERIDSSEYFIAFITPKSIDEQIGRYSRFEVFYALDTGKLKQNKILPIIFNRSGKKWTQWQALYEKLEPMKRIELSSVKSDGFEDHLREICSWLSVKYVPSSLRSRKTFFAEAFLKEADKIDLRLADFVQLMNIMDSCANRVEKGDWQAARERADLFLLLANHSAPRAKFFYPLIIRGVCELELNDTESARRTFLTATDKHFEDNALYGLAFAGLGQIHFTLGQYEEASLAYQKATELMKDDKLILINQLNSLIHAGSDSWDEAELEKFDQIDIPSEYRFKFLELKGTAKYKKGKFSEAVQIFNSVKLKTLGEAAAIYYGLSLLEMDEEKSALKVFLTTAPIIKTPNIYHYLAVCYLRCEHIPEALTVYRDILCHSERPENWKRQYFIEYARLLRNVNKKKYRDTIRALCEKVLDFDAFSFPQSREDFFFLGFANYLLGNVTEAKLDYKRSAGFCEFFYDQIID